ncbi:hypothetical protein [Kitasatospora sp. NPDC054795]
MYEQVGEDDVICFGGAQEGLNLAVQVLLEPGDHALVLTPGHQCAETVPLSLREVTGVAPDAKRPGRRPPRGVGGRHPGPSGVPPGSGQSFCQAGLAA